MVFENDIVDKYNQSKLHSLNNGQILIAAVHNNGKASKLPDEEFGGLKPSLLICPNARVMLTRNLWIKHGLCNGSMGYIKYVVYQEQQSPPSLPIAVIVQFDNYTGPSLLQNEEKLVAITPILAETYHIGMHLERQQLPLKLCWALTIHKSQGLTLSKTNIDIGMTERTAGLAYVTLSRVKTLEEFLIEPKSYERLSAVKKCINFNLRVSEETRLDDLSNQTQLTIRNSHINQLLRNLLL